MKRPWASVALVTAIGVWISSASAIEIKLSFRSYMSESPSFDPTGAQLQSIMSAAASLWEDIIQDSWTLNISYYWEDLEETTLGDCLTTRTSGGKVSRARIRFDTASDSAERLWYLDPTPTDHGEYRMEQELFGDLYPSEQSEGFNGSPPDLLEVGYSGSVIGGTGPGPLRDGYDLLSVAMHEMGHALGMASQVASGEVGDGDYDVSPDSVGGAVMAVEAYADDKKYHLKPHGTLMYPAMRSGKRILPGATDVFALASAVGWTELDLPRQDFLGGWSDSWGAPRNWEGNRVPDAADEAYVRHGGTVAIEGNASVKNLFIHSGSTLSMDAGSALSADEVDIGEGATLNIAPAGLLEADGKIVMQAGSEYVCQLDGLGSGKIAAAGDIHLGGTLTLHPVSVGTPGNTSRTIITAAGTDGVIGTFDEVPPEHDPELGPAGHLGLGVFCRGVDYVPDPLRPEIVSSVSVDLFVAQGGDGNGDGEVDTVDITNLVANFGLAGELSWLENDTAGGTTGRGDGKVDVVDLTDLVANFGISPASQPDPGPGPEGSAVGQYNPRTGEFTVVPEPGTVAMLAGGLLALLLVWRRRAARDPRSPTVRRPSRR